MFQIEESLVLTESKLDQKNTENEGLQDSLQQATTREAKKGRGREGKEKRKGRERGREKGRGGTRGKREEKKEGGGVVVTVASVFQNDVMHLRSSSLRP